MKKLVALSALLSGIVSTGPLHAAPPKSGSACVDVNVSATCSANVVVGTISVTNCGAGADTVNLSATLVDASGVVLASQGASAYLKAGKSTNYTVRQPVPSDMPAGLYGLTVTGVAAKGGGRDTATLSLNLPCP